MWLFSLAGLLSVPSIAGQPEVVITQAGAVHALPGTDVTLVCSLPKPHATHIIQTQWAKISGNQLTRLAVYHPIFGTHYFTFPEASYNFSVSFSMRKCCSSDITEALCSADPNTVSECSQWALHLRNVTVSLSGQYECSFATYPHGTKAANIQLAIEAEEEEQHYVKEVRLNQTLEIPCLEDATSGNLSNYPLKWLVEENGRKEELVTKEPSHSAVYWNGSALYRQRVRLGLNNALKIFSSKPMDDGRVFSCHVLLHPERVRKSSTTVAVFAYPEMSVSLQEGSAGTSQKSNVTCVVRKAFPKPNLMWYLDRSRLMEKPAGISVEQEDLRDSEGFYQLRSTLMLQGTHQTHKVFSCVCQFSFLGNEIRTISSEEIVVSSENTSNEASYKGFTTMASEEHQLTSLASLDFTRQASLAPTYTTQAGGPNSTTETGSNTILTAFNGSPTTAYLKDSTTKSPQSLGSTTWSSENKTLAHYVTRNLKASHFPWPAVVSILLLFCSFLIVLGIRKWCQYQKEIMNRPPSFKPPPPPIKYASMVESDGTPPSCHELENLYLSPTPCN